MAINETCSTLSTWGTDSLALKLVLLPRYLVMSGFSFACVWYENNVTGFLTYLILTGQSPNWIEIINAAKLQFFRGLIIHFSICQYLALVRLTFYFLSTSIKCLALKSEVKRKNKDLKFFVGFSCLLCIWKIRCLQFTLFKRLLELFNRKVLKLGRTPSYHPDNFFEIKWINKCLTHC